MRKKNKVKISLSLLKSNVQAMEQKSKKFMSSVSHEIDLLIMEALKRKEEEENEKLKPSAN